MSTAFAIGCPGCCFHAQVNALWLMLGRLLLYWMSRRLPFGSDEIVLAKVFLSAPAHEFCRRAARRRRLSLLRWPDRDARPSAAPCRLHALRARSVSGSSPVQQPVADIYCPGSASTT